MPRGSTRVGQVSQQLSCVAILLAHVGTGGPHLGVGHLTSEPQICHVTLTHWSMSASTSLDRDKWHHIIGAYLHMSAG
jgi:hypothetical protein